MRQEHCGKLGGTFLLSSPNAHVMCRLGLSSDGTTSSELQPTFPQPKKPILPILHPKRTKRRKRKSRRRRRKRRSQVRRRSLRMMMTRKKIWDLTLALGPSKLAVLISGTSILNGGGPKLVSYSRNHSSSTIQSSTTWRLAYAGLR